MNVNEKINYWLELSLDDLDSAEIMLSKNKFLQSGFYCHQAVEKIIKRYFWFINNDEPPYTHNLNKLSEKSGLTEKLNEEFIKLIDVLMPLNIEARYPDNKREIMKHLDSEKTSRIYAGTRDLVEWIQKQITR
jgi:HEPN domain-containing protein